jgi:hypothetical protein
VPWHLGLTRMEGITPLPPAAIDKCPTGWHATRLYIHCSYVRSNASGACGPCCWQMVAVACRALRSSAVQRNELSARQASTKRHGYSPAAGGLATFERFLHLVLTASSALSLSKRYVTHSVSTSSLTCSNKP